MPHHPIYDHLKDDKLVLMKCLLPLDNPFLAKVVILSLAYSEDLPLLSFFPRLSENGDFKCLSRIIKNHVKIKVKQELTSEKSLKERIKQLELQLANEYSVNEQLKLREQCKTKNLPRIFAENDLVLAVKKIKSAQKNFEFKEFLDAVEKQFKDNIMPTLDVLTNLNPKLNFGVKKESGVYKEGLQKYLILYGILKKIGRVKLIEMKKQADLLAKRGKKDWGILAIDYNRVNCIVNLTSYQIFKDNL